MKINEFARLFDDVGMAVAILANDPLAGGLERIKSSLEMLTVIRYNDLIEEVEHNINYVPDKGQYLIGLMRKFKEYKLLNITLDSSEEQEAGLIIQADRIDLAHKYLKSYQLNPTMDMENIPLLYLIICWETLNMFMKKLDVLLLEHDIDMIAVQRKYNENIWYRVVNGKAVVAEKLIEKSDEKSTLNGVSNDYKGFGRYLMNCNRDKVLADMWDKLNGKKGKTVAYTLMAYEKKGYLTYRGYTIPEVVRAFGTVGSHEGVSKYYHTANSKTLEAKKQIKDILDKII